MIGRLYRQGEPMTKGSMLQGFRTEPRYHEITGHDDRAGDVIGTAIAMTGWDDNGPEYGEHVAQLLAAGGWVLVRIDGATSGRKRGPDA